MARKNKTRYAVLGVLSHQPSSGYDIKKAFERYIGEIWSESYGQIYPMTKALVDEDCATPSVEQTEGRPDRRVLSITDKGMAELQEWLAQPTEPHKERLEVLLKLMCAAHMPIEANIRLVERFREEWSGNLRKYAGIEAALRAEHEGSPHLPYFLMSVNCGMYLGNAYVAWCDETLAALRAMQDTPEVQSEE